MIEPDVLDPYAAHVHLTTREATHLDPIGLVEGLLEDVAERTTFAGASLLGHLKCLVRGGDGRVLHASLTDRRTGAHAEGDPPEECTALDMDLVVLVYGLDASVTHESVLASVRAAAMRTHSRWSVEAASGERQHPQDPHPR